MFRCYLKTCSVPLEHVIRVNHCLQVFSDHVNSSRCHSIRSPLIPCAVCILLHDVLWMIMHHQKWSGRDEYLHKHTGAAFSPCGSMWLRIITKSFHSSCLWNDHDCSGKTWQSKSHSTCLSEELCASVEFWIGSCSLTWQLIWVFIQTSRKYQFFHSSAA